jgi:hypothetical protein
MNMSDFEQQFHNWMRQAPRPDPRRSASLREEVVHNYDERLKKVEQYMRWWLWGIGAGLILTSIVMSLGAAFNTTVLIYGATLFLACGQMNVIVKLWYWIVNAKLNVLKEIQDLRLQLLEEWQERQHGTESSSGETGSSQT